MLLSSVLFFLVFVYAAIMLAYQKGWNAASAFQMPVDFEAKTAVTVIIPARNEAAHIQTCLTAILNGNYPPALLEILIIDDFSTDDTALQVQHLVQNNHLASGRLHLVSLSAHLPAERRFYSNKKQGIEMAVKMAKGTLVVATDADCITPPNWLRLIVARFQATPELKILTGPVLCHRETNLSDFFQSLDVLGMAGITGAGMHLGLHRMGNGANLAYQKSAFEQVGGYAGNRHIASGDDMFLLQKMAAEWPDGVAFLKNTDATVLTSAQAGWRAFWRQRVRWGSKNAALPEWPIRLILLAMLLGCWSIWLGIAFWALGWGAGFVLLGQILLKAGADYWLLSTLATYFERRDLLRWFWPSLVLHMAYVALIGLASVWHGLTKHRAVSAPQGRRSHADKWV